MKRIALIGVLLAVLLGSAVAAASGPGVSVSGAGFVTWTDTPTPGMTTTELAIVSAHLSPSGRLSGTLVNLSPYGFNVATVTCLKVVGDTVYVGGPFKPGFDVYNGQTYGQVAFGIKDGGAQGDLIAGGVYTRTDVNTCDKLSNIAATLPVHPGNFVVTGI